MTNKIGENNLPPMFYRQKSGKPLKLPPMKMFSFSFVNFFRNLFGLVALVLLVAGCDESKPEIGVAGSTVTVSVPVEATPEVPFKEPDLPTTEEVSTGTVDIVESTSGILTTSNYNLVAKNMNPTSGGWYVAYNLNSTNACYLQARASTAAKAGQTSTFTYQQKTNVIPDGKKNIKNFRAYNSSTEDYSNFYLGRSVNSNSHSITVENGDGKVAYRSKSPNAWNVAYFDMKLKPDVVQTVTVETKYSNPKGTGTGSIKITVDGAIVFSSGGLICNAPMRDYGVQMVNANPGTYGKLPVGSYLEARVIGLEIK